MDEKANLQLRIGLTLLLPQVFSYIMRKSLAKFEYASNWSITCRRVYKLQPRCTNNPLHGRASVVHHIKYKRSFLRRFLGIFLLHFPHASLSGYEILGWDCVGVCSRCHQNYYGRSNNRASAIGLGFTAGVSGKLLVQKGE